jgi:hypothetical protein
MPQYQGVWTLEQQAQAQSNQQWVTDPNFKNTTLLLQADGTGSGSQNQTFLDGSTNNFFITRNGNTTQGSFSPFSQAPGYWSNYFNGSSTISAASNSAFNILAYDTFECWVNMSVLGSNDLIAGRDGNFWLGYNHTSISGTANKFVFSIWNGSSWQAVSSTTTPTVGVWYHILGVKDNTTLRFYVNGVQENTATFSGTPVTTGTFYVASNNNTENLEGYVSNLRLITGASNAVFPYAGLTTGAAFTPQTTPLTAVSSTQLLTCQTNRFVDNSTNAFALTAVSVPSVQAFGPFAPALQWTPTVVGGSGYFDGTGDYLLTPSTTTLALGTSDFTYETWFYPTATGGSKPIAYNYTGSGGFVVYWTAGNAVQLLLAAPSAWAVNFTSAAMPLNAWMHIAVVRSGTTVYFFINGVLLSTTTGVSGSMGTVALQSGTGGDPTGGEIISASYISGTRLVKGTALYTAAFTPPTTPPTAVANTSLLLNYTNAGIYDGKMANNLETVGNAQVSTSPVKYGSGSMYFNGSTSYLTRPYSPLFALGNGNFTIECWINTTQNGGANVPSVVGRWSGGNSWDLRHSASDNSGKPTFAYNDGSSNFNVLSTGSTVYDGQWHHLAAVRNNNIITLYVDGINVGTSTFTGTIAAATSTPLTVGSTSGGGIYYTGYIDDLRITVGVARYFTNFTPPQQALPRQ